MRKENSFPEPGMELTTILVIKDIERSRQFYETVLGAEVFREYAGTSLVIKLLGNWILLVTGGDPTEDKPDISFEAPFDSNKVSHSFTIRVNDCRKTYHILKERGAQFITPPMKREFEIRAFFKDPDGHLFEISELTD